MLNRFGIYLRALRGKKQLTQAQVASRLGATQSTISELENGKRRPGKTIILQLAEILEVDVEKLEEQASEHLSIEERMNVIERKQRFMESQMQDIAEELALIRRELRGK